MQKIKLIDIFVAFLYSGLILLGGGYVILPILQEELVKKRNWISNDELTDYYAISQSLPGLISINIAILTGYKLRGKSGAVVGVFGITFFAFWMIVALSSVITKYTFNPYVQGAFWAIEIAVVILIISAIREMWEKSVKDLSTFVIFFLTLVIMLTTKISPAYIIIASVFIGIGYKSYTQAKNREVDND